MGEVFNEGREGRRRGRQGLFRDDTKKAKPRSCARLACTNDGPCITMNLIVSRCTVLYATVLWYHHIEPNAPGKTCSAKRLSMDRDSETCKMCKIQQDTTEKNERILPSINKWVRYVSKIESRRRLQKRETNRPMPWSLSPHVSPPNMTHLGAGSNRPKKS